MKRNIIEGTPVFDHIKFMRNPFARYDPRQEVISRKYKQVGDNQLLLANPVNNKQIENTKDPNFVAPQIHQFKYETINQIPECDRVYMFKEQDIAGTLWDNNRVAKLRLSETQLLLDDISAKLSELNVQAGLTEILKPVDVEFQTEQRTIFEIGEIIRQLIDLNPNDDDYIQLKTDLLRQQTEKENELATIQSRLKAARAQLAEAQNKIKDTELGKQIAQLKISEQEAVVEVSAWQTRQTDAAAQMEIMRLDQLIASEKQKIILAKWNEESQKKKLAKLQSVGGWFESGSFSNMFGDLSSSSSSIWTIISIIVVLIVIVAIANIISRANKFKKSV